MAPTESRNFRIPRVLWVAAQDKARRTGITVSDRVRDGLQQWVDADDDLWDAAETRAETEGTTVQDVIRAALEDYVCHLLCSCGHHSYDHDGDPSGTVGESCGLCKCNDFTPAWATR